MAIMSTTKRDTQQVGLKEAKARLSAVVDAAMQGEATIITRRGKPQAVVLGYEEYLRLAKRKPSFAELLMAFPLGEEDAHLFERDQSPPRDVEF